MTKYINGRFIRMLTGCPWVIPLWLSHTGEVKNPVTAWSTRQMSQQSQSGPEGLQGSQRAAGPQFTLEI